MIQLTIPGPNLRVAALYVQADGVYSAMPDVDPWDQARDARTYPGQHLQTYQRGGQEASDWWCNRCAEAEELLGDEEHPRQVPGESQV